MLSNMKKFIAHIILIFLIPIHLVVCAIAFLLRMFARWLGGWAKYFVGIVMAEHENQN
jgi:hypothetical protein